MKNKKISVNKKAVDKKKITHEKNKNKIRVKNKKCNIVQQTQTLAKQRGNSPYSNIYHSSWKINVKVLNFDSFLIKVVDKTNKIQVELGTGPANT